MFDIFVIFNFCVSLNKRNENWSYKCQKKLNFVSYYFSTAAW